MSKNKEVYVLGLDYEVKNTIHWTDAVQNILVGKMSPFKVDETERVKSKYIDMAFPLIVRLNYWKPTPAPKKVNLNDRASRTDILLRDGRTCAYCGELARTVDHIKPESRCKRDKEPHDGWTWGNLVACCWDCNQYKGNRTPEEAGMKLLWSPRTVGNKYAKVQKEVWKILEEGGGFVEESLNYEGIIQVS